MEELATITAENGELMPATVINATNDRIKNPVLLKIVSKEIPGEASVAAASPSTDDASDSSDDTSEGEDGFYVELSLTCTNDDGEQEDRLVTFNFETEDNYLEHGENGFEDLETYFQDGISMNHAGWCYADEWEEHHIHGNELPEDHEGEIVDIQ